MKTLLILALLISGCATNYAIISPSKQYGQSNMPLAESGRIKWSDYYLGYYDKLRLESNKNTGNELIIFNELIDAAKEYEAGTINKDKFESKRRDARGRLQQLESDNQLTKEDSIFNYPYPPAYNPPRTTNCTTSGGQTFCSTY
jgi:hypothetical protein